jgi:hypothetical protein
MVDHSTLLPTFLRVNRASSRRFDSAPYVPQGRQDRQFKVEKIRNGRAQRPEPLGVNADTEGAEIKRRRNRSGCHGKSWVREGRVWAEPVDARAKHEER